MSETTPRNDVDVDSIFTVLANERRRLILEHLLTKQFGDLLRNQSPVSVRELVDHLKTVERNGHDRPGEPRNRIDLALHHVHLPKLAASNFIDYDPEQGEVTLRKSAITVEPYLALAGAKS